MDELVTVVNSNNQVVGSKIRAEITFDDIYRVAALWVTNSKGDVLLAQRHHTKKVNPGKWGPAVAGTVGKDETYETCMYREAEEELGITGVKLELGPAAYNEDNRRYFSQWFTAVLDWPVSKFKIQADEVEQIRWVPKAKLIEMIQTHPEHFTPSHRYWVNTFLSN